METTQVTISVENLVPENGTFLTPLWFGFHDGTFDTYDRGRPVSPGVESLAEDGDLPIISREFELAGFGTVQGAIEGQADTPGPIDPGETATFTVELDSNDPSSRFFNYASMVIPSNDFFIANGDERAHQIFDDQGNFIGADFIVAGSNVLDAGSEVNDEVPENTAFFGQQNPDTGTPENGVVQLAEGFIPDGPILSEPNFANADFTAPDYQVARIQVFAAFSGDEGQNTFMVRPGDTITITDFGGVGRGINPSPETIAEVDTLKFEGAGLKASNMILFQNGSDLEIVFEGVPETQVTLKDFEIENLDNLSDSIGNILFDEQTIVEDSFDVINVDAEPDRVFNRNTVTYLNLFDNNVRGFNSSDDVINGQRGNDTLHGLSGDDLLRGLLGNDALMAGRGADTLIGGVGDDRLNLGSDSAVDTVIYRDGDGSDLVNQFRRGAGGDLLSFEDIDAIDVVVDERNTLFHLSDGIEGNAGFGSGQLLAELQDLTGLSADNIELNLAASNTAQFAFS